MKPALFALMAAGLAAACAPKPADAPAATPSAAAATEAAAPAFKVLNASAYQSFVGNWEPDDKPTCAALQSEADWNAVMHPAAGMTQSKPFAPPEATWSQSAILLLATVIAPPEDFNKVYEVTDVKRTAEAITVAYKLHLPAEKTYSVKAPLYIEVAKPLPPTVRFELDGQETCSRTAGK